MQPYSWASSESTDFRGRETRRWGRTVCGSGRGSRQIFSFLLLISILLSPHHPLLASLLLTIHASAWPSLHHVCQFSSDKQGCEGVEGDKWWRREHEMEMGGDGSQDFHIRMGFYFNNKHWPRVLSLLPLSGSFAISLSYPRVGETGD